mmetsp:Transcript_42578/g.88958  ORF Transcript_42578/g.88958 Transcript_42578/m.88958 type:complete len:253 (-) Transcript_42578:74-832(-)
MRLTRLSSYARPSSQKLKWTRPTSLSSVKRWSWIGRLPSASCASTKATSCRRSPPSSPCSIARLACPLDELALPATCIHTCLPAQLLAQLPARLPAQPPASLPASRPAHLTTAYSSSLLLLPTYLTASPPHCRSSTRLPTDRFSICPLVCLPHLASRDYLTIYVAARTERARPLCARPYMESSTDGSTITRICRWLPLGARANTWYFGARMRARAQNLEALECNAVLTRLHTHNRDQIDFTAGSMKCSYSVV